MMDRRRIEDALFSMGIPAAIRGFKYIADAIEIIDEKGMVPMTKELYPAVAEKNNSKPSRVERSIRHAFFVARGCNGDFSAVEHYIGFDHISNSASLSKMHMMLKREEND